MKTFKCAICGAVNKLNPNMEMRELCRYCDIGIKLFESVEINLNYHKSSRTELDGFSYLKALYKYYIKNHGLVQQGL